MTPHTTITSRPQHIQTNQLIERYRVLETTIPKKRQLETAFTHVYSSVIVRCLSDIRRNGVVSTSVWSGGHFGVVWRSLRCGLAVTSVWSGGHFGVVWRVSCGFVGSPHPRRTTWLSPSIRLHRNLPYHHAKTRSSR